MECGGLLPPGADKHNHYRHQHRITESTKRQSDIYRGARLLAKEMEYSELLSRGVGMKSFCPNYFDKTLVAERQTDGQAEEWLGMKK